MYSIKGSGYEWTNNNNKKTMRDQSGMNSTVFLNIGAQMLPLQEKEDILL